MSDAKEGLNGLGGSKFRSKFDTASGYWKLPMEPGALEMAAFVTKHGLYELVVMPFGLTNAPPTFQQMMDSMILGGYTLMISSSTPQHGRST